MNNDKHHMNNSNKHITSKQKQMFFLKKIKSTDKYHVKNKKPCEKIKKHSPARAEKNPKFAYLILLDNMHRCSNS